MNRRKLGARLCEEALGGGGKVPLAALLETLVPVKKLRELAREHGLSPKGGFRLEKAPARVLGPLLTVPETPLVLEEVCEMLAEHMTRDLTDRQKRSESAAEGEPAPDLQPALELKTQDLSKARSELEKSREVAQGLRRKVDELTRQRQQDVAQITRLNVQRDTLSDRLARLGTHKPIVTRDASSRIQSLEKELEEQNQIEEQQRIRMAEQAAMIRDRDERITELEELVPKGRRRKRPRSPPPPPDRFIVPYFTAAFLKSLASKDRRSVEHGYRAVFLYCTEGSRHPGLQVKSLGSPNVWSLRASLKLRVYFRPRPDGDVDLLELLDRQEQETALRRYREKFS